MAQLNLYLDDTYLFSQKAFIIDRSVGYGSNWVAVDDNIFHPQGGGQPSDIGMVDGHQVQPRLLADRGLVILDLASDVTNFAVGDSVVCDIDKDYRRLLAALHTAGHLVDGVVSAMGFPMVRNNHFPGESRIEFTDDRSGPHGDSLMEELLARVNEAIDARISVFHEVSDGQRVVHIEGLHSAPCGGTHVTELGDLEDFGIPSIRTKRGSLRVRYDVKHRNRSD